MLFDDRGNVNDSVAGKQDEDRKQISVCCVLGVIETIQACHDCACVVTHFVT